MEQDTLCTVEIESIEIVAAPVDMVDITVQDDHTYWVSTNGNDWVLTHNTSWPDIDSDVGDRDVLIEAAQELYGDDAVIPVSNFNTLKLKSLLHDVSKYYDVPHGEVVSLTKKLEDEVMPLAKDENTEKSVFVLRHDDCLEYSKKYRDFMDKYPRVKEHIETLFMQNRNMGRHAGGVIIATPDELERTMPVITVARKESGQREMQTPWTEGMNFRNLEDNGFIKFDFLGLTLMKDVENCIRRILIKKGNSNPTFLEIRDYFDKNLNCRFNDPSDQKVFKRAYHRKDFAPGLFQFTADGAREFCRKVRPTDVVELAAITAIYRPGPLKANVHQKYVKTKRELLQGETITYDHPIIEEILSPTLGYISFQEQFMLLSQKLAGFSPAESDKLRKTLVKKSLDTMGKKGDERAAAREKFIRGAQELHGISPNVTEPLWKKIEFFSVYGFNKSHAVAYAIDSYFAAWLFTYYPEEWIATILQTNNTKPKKLSKTVNELKRLGYRIDKLDINRSGSEWEYDYEIKAFVPPLSSIKKVGDTSAAEIIATRPFTSLHDLLYNDEGKWYHSKMNKGSFESLCKVEAFSSLTEFENGHLENHRQLHDLLLENWDKLRKGSKGMSATAVKRLEKKGEVVPDILDVLLAEVEGIDDWTRSEKIGFNDNLRSAVSNDMLFPEGLLEKLEAKEIIPVTQVPGGRKMIAWFLVRDIEERKTKKGKTYHRIRAQDHDNNQIWLKVWGGLKFEIPLFSVWMCEATGDDNWGPSTTSWKIRPLELS